MISVVWAVMLVAGGSDVSSDVNSSGGSGVSSRWQ